MASLFITSLPTGRRGRILAILVTLGVILLLWLGAVSPLMDLYQSDAEVLAQREALAGRMQDLADALPELRKRVAASQPKDTPAAALLAGTSDAVAAANLQSLLGAMCNTTGAKINSAEALPAEAAGTYRQIALRVSLDASWVQLTHLLREVRKATPEMFVDDLQLHAQPTNDKVRELPLDIALTVFAFRPGDAAPGSAAAAAAAPDPGQSAPPAASP